MAVPGPIRIIAPPADQPMEKYILMEHGGLTYALLFDLLASAISRSSDAISGALSLARALLFRVYTSTDAS